MLFLTDYTKTMRKFAALLIFIFIPSLFFAQNTISVSRLDNKPIKGASIYCVDKFLGKTDDKGELKKALSKKT